jgi:hypothetical protein
MAGIEKGLLSIWLKITEDIHNLLMKRCVNKYRKSGGQKYAEQFIASLNKREGSM